MKRKKLYTKTKYSMDYKSIIDIKKIIKKYLSYDLLLIGTRPINGKMPYISKIIYELLECKKNITLFGFDGNINYYLEYILNNITGIDRKVIHQYLNPCTCYVNKILSIDNNKYIKGIKYLLRKDLNILDYHLINDMVINGTNTLLDKIIYLINDGTSKVIIIDNLECISDNLENTLRELKKLSILKNIKFIIFNNLKREYEINKNYDISSFKNSLVLDNYIDYISILDNDKLVLIKEISSKNCYNRYKLKRCRDES